MYLWSWIVYRDQDRKLPAISTFHMDTPLAHQGRWAHKQEWANVYAQEESVAACWSLAPAALLSRHTNRLHVDSVP